MPAKSIAQQHLFQAAEHGAQFPMAQQLRNTMSQPQLHDFSVGSEAGKPEHVGASPTPPSNPFESPQPAPAQTPLSLLRGNAPSIVGSNTSGLRQSGLSEFDATRKAISLAGPTKKRTPTHTNLGKYLHPRKDGKPHGSGSENF